MDTKLLLVKAITLLFLESQLPNQTTNSAELVKSALALIKFPDNAIISEFSKDPVTGMRDLISTMVQKPVDYAYDKKELLQTIRVLCNNDEGLYGSLYDGICTDCDDDKLRVKAISYRNAINTFVLRWSIKDVIKTAYNQMSFQQNTIEWRSFVPELMSKLEKFRDTEYVDAVHPSIVRDINLSDVDAVRDVFQRASDELDTNGVLHLHLQGLNRMTGFVNGLRRGEFIVLPALQHNYKSGMTLDIFAGIAKYNTPKLRNPDKKALLMRCSFENPIEQDIMHLYKNIVENKTGIEVDPRDIDLIEAADYVVNELRATGFEINMCQIDPSEFSYADLFDRINKFEAEGFEIVFLELDYLAMMSKRGCAQGATGQDVRDLFRRVRNFTSKRGITTLTPHQLSTDAKTLVRMGVDNFVKEIANKGYYDGCKTIDQEVDMEIYIHIVKINGESYLTIQRGKHRRMGAVTPEIDLFTVYKFERIGNVPDDVLGVDMSRRAPGHEPASRGGATPWYAMAS